MPTRGDGLPSHPTFPNHQPQKTSTAPSGLVGDGGRGGQLHLRGRQRRLHQGTYRERYRYRYTHTHTHERACFRIFRTPPPPSRLTTHPTLSPSPNPQDEKMRERLLETNPNALRDMVTTFLEVLFVSGAVSLCRCGWGGTHRVGRLCMFVCYICITTPPLTKKINKPLQSTPPPTGQRPRVLGDGRGEPRAAPGALRGGGRPHRGALSRL